MTHSNHSLGKWIQSANNRIHSSLFQSCSQGVVWIGLIK